MKFKSKLSFYQITLIYFFLLALQSPLMGAKSTNVQPLCATMKLDPNVKIPLELQVKVFTWAYSPTCSGWKEISFGTRLLSGQKSPPLCNTSVIEKCGIQPKDLYYLGELVIKDGLSKNSWKVKYGKYDTKDSIDVNANGNLNISIKPSEDYNYLEVTVSGNATKQYLAGPY